MNPSTRLHRTLLTLALFTSFAAPAPGADAVDTPPLIAHRGASDAAPENTLAAIREAWKEGADATEIDVRLTADRKIVLCHDATTRRTSAENLTVAESTLAELHALEAGAWKAPQWAGEPYPTLGEALAAIPEGKRLFIEIKCGPEILPALKRALSTTELPQEQMVFISFNADVIRVVRATYPEIPAYWLTGFRPTLSGWAPTIDTILATLKDIDATGLDCNAHPSVDAAFVAALRAQDYEFHVWTVDAPTTARRFMELGVDSITTNRPAALRAALTAP